MSPSGDTIVSEDDKTTVLMTGIQRHHADTFKTTLEVLDQGTDNITFEETYKRLLLADRKADALNLPKRSVEEKGMIADAHKSKDLCRNFSKGRCQRGSKCKYQHARAPSSQRKSCSHCGKSSHTVDRCFKLHGFPNKSKNTTSSANGHPNIKTALLR